MTPRSDTPERPLLRTSLTVAHPDDDYPATIQIVVLLDVGEDMATPADLPELREAGWINHRHGPLNVSMRTIS